MVNKTHKLAENVFLLNALYLYVLSKYRIILLQMAAFHKSNSSIGKTEFAKCKIQPLNQSFNNLANFSTVRIFSL